MPPRDSYILKSRTYNGCLEYSFDGINWVKVPGITLEPDANSVSFKKKIKEIPLTELSTISKLFTESDNSI